MISADETKLKSKLFMTINIIGCCFPQSMTWKHFFISLTDCLDPTPKISPVGKPNIDDFVVDEAKDVDVVDTVGVKDWFENL